MGSRFRFLSGSASGQRSDDRLHGFNHPTSLFFRSGKADPAGLDFVLAVPAIAVRPQQAVVALVLADAVEAHDLAEQFRLASLAAPAAVFRVEPVVDEAVEPMAKVKD